MGRLADYISSIEQKRNARIERQLQPIYQQMEQIANMKEVKERRDKEYNWLKTQYVDLNNQTQFNVEIPEKENLDFMKQDLTQKRLLIDKAKFGINVGVEIEEDQTLEEYVKKINKQSTKNEYIQQTIMINEEGEEVVVTKNTFTGKWTDSEGNEITNIGDYSKPKEIEEPKKPEIKEIKEGNKITTYEIDEQGNKIKVAEASRWKDTGQDLVEVMKQEEVKNYVDSMDYSREELVAINNQIDIYENALDNLESTGLFGLGGIKATVTIDGEPYKLTEKEINVKIKELEIKAKAEQDNIDKNIQRLKELGLEERESVATRPTRIRPTEPKFGRDKSGQARLSAEEETDLIYKEGEDSKDIGLFQINNKAHPELVKKYDLLDPTQNIQAAKIVYDKQGFDAWVQYGNGGYKEYLDEKSEYHNLIKQVFGDNSQTMEAIMLAESNGKPDAIGINTPEKKKAAQDSINTGKGVKKETKEYTDDTIVTYGDWTGTIRQLRQRMKQTYPNRSDEDIDKAMKKIKRKNVYY